MYGALLLPDTSCGHLYCDNKLFKKEGYYLIKLFAGWDKSWKLLLPLMSQLLTLLLYLFTPPFAWWSQQ